MEVQIIRLSDSFGAVHLCCFAVTCCFLVPCIVDLYGSFLYYFITEHYTEPEKEIGKSIAQDFFFKSCVGIYRYIYIRKCNLKTSLILESFYYKAVLYLIMLMMQLNYDINN